MAGPITALAQLVGAPVAALTLLISILLGFPLAIIYRKYLRDQSATVQHIYFAATGCILCLFNYGFDVYHSLIAISVTYLLVYLLHESPYLAVVNFVFHMSYLLIGYYFTESNEYDIKWTMPHCVLVLRLIGLVYDISDGYNLKPEEWSKDQRETALQRRPTLLEMMAFTYFPSSCLVGPQFPFRRYERFVAGEFDKYDGNTEAGLKRAGIGLFYLLVRQIGSGYFPDAWFLTEEYANLGFGWKLLYLGVWGKISLYKYISCWLLTEGSLIYFGLTYNGKNSETGENDWSGCSNVNLRIFEPADKMSCFIISFNVNTNHWLAQYVYKRLKFMGNRTISYGAALGFLALWHGFHSGYYMSFFLEYLTITFEKQFETIFNAKIQPKIGNILETTPAKILLGILLRAYTIIHMGFCLVPFIFLSYPKWTKVYGTLYYYSCIMLAGWFTFYFVYKSFLEKKKPKKVKDDELKTTRSSNDYQNSDKTNTIINNRKNNIEKQHIK